MILASILFLNLAYQNPVTLPAPTTSTSSVTDSKDKKDKDKNATSHTYASDQLGLAFDYPATWKQSRVTVKNDTRFAITDPKTWRPPKKDITDRFLIPLPGADEKGVLEIFSAIYNQDEDTWQTIQKDINAKMNRDVLKQWSEELLGVPLLMTKIESHDKGLDLITETGLMYSATPRKLIFRLTASPQNFDKADYAWRQVMQTIHTTNGDLPSSEDPNRKLTPADMVPGKYHQVIWTAKDPTLPPPWKGEEIASAQTAGKQVDVRGPSGWKVAKNSDGSFNLTSPDLTGIVKLTISNDIDSDPAGRALIKSSGATLQSFAKVAKREEPGPFENRGRANVDWIFRRGQDGVGKPIFSFDAAGINGDEYWIITWLSSDAGALGKDRHTLESLADQLYIVPGH